jgi:hypothetical protein
VSSFHAGHTGTTSGLPSAPTVAMCAQFESRTVAALTSPRSTSPPSGRNDCRAIVPGVRRSGRAVPAGSVGRPLVRRYTAGLVAKAQAADDGDRDYSAILGRNVEATGAPARGRASRTGMTAAGMVVTQAPLTAPSPGRTTAGRRRVMRSAARRRRRRAQHCSWPCARSAERRGSPTSAAERRRGVRRQW